MNVLFEEALRNDSWHADLFALSSQSLREVDLCSHVKYQF